MCVLCEDMCILLVIGYVSIVIVVEVIKLGVDDYLFKLVIVLMILCVLGEEDDGLVDDGDFELLDVMILISCL